MKLRRPLVIAALCATAMACEGRSISLRERVLNSGVFSPVRLDIGNPQVTTLGQVLFFDAELSGNRNIACATCHPPVHHSTDGNRIAFGQDGARLSRSVPDLFNRGGEDPLFVDGRLEHGLGGIVADVVVPSGLSLLEAQALLPLLDRHEMRGQAGDLATDGRQNELAQFPDGDGGPVWSAVMTRLLALEGYRALFAAAYPSVPTAELSIVHVARALAAFERRLWELNDTMFDRWLGSVGAAPDDSALLPPMQKGAELFFGDAGCSRCHNGPLLSDGKFHAIGAPQIGPGRDAQHRDVGRFAVTEDPVDYFAFRTPPLRNVALTGPYMHDGAYRDLFTAVQHHLDPAMALSQYDGLELPADLRAEMHPELNEYLLTAVGSSTKPARRLDDWEVGALVEFLGALTSDTELTLPPNPGVPDSVPSGLPIPLRAPVD